MTGDLKLANVNMEYEKSKFCLFSQARLKTEDILFPMQLTYCFYSANFALLKKIYMYSLL